MHIRDRDYKIENLKAENEKLRREIGKPYDKVDRLFEANRKLIKENEILREALEFYANFDSWRTTNNQRTYATIDDDDLGNGDFKQSTGPNHALNSVSCLDNGGRRAREALEKVKSEKS